MRIGIIAEGSYPYVRGGVSSWIHTLINSMPDQEFVLISIMPDTSQTEADYVYELPANLTEIRTFGLLPERQRRRRVKPLREDEQAALKRWITFKETNPEALTLIGERLQDPRRFFQSRAFYDIVRTCYQDDGGSGSFNSFLWMFRSMTEPVIQLLQQDFPDVDLVHAVSTGYAGLAASYMAESRGLPFILTEHGIYPREREEEILQANWIAPAYKKRWVDFYYHLSRQTYQAADSIITLFEQSRQHQIMAGAPEHAALVIPNGVDYETLSSLPRKAPGEEPFTIGAVIRMVPIKDIKTMIHAALVLRERGRSFRWMIMGPLEEDPAYAEDCIALVQQNNLEENVVFTGNVNIKEYLPEIDVGVLSSISEGQPLAVLEGMAAGLPFVTTNVGSCSELINGIGEDHFGPAGFVVPPVDPEAMADRIEWLMDNPVERLRFAGNGQRRIEAYYQLPQVTGAYEHMYKQKGGVSIGRSRV
ncbi:GT4 family glycosyltransferase PelF [Alkalicoccus urumqiensis]|uniref:Glycoside hydrolase n=1 Tax=Alkalicoccus urumqiensis TaxID=1548213 RepID=A0A2P6MLB7_ALKUR|nr:GT4 family glycosyltransferase PelF [Alkalicoccus urumqiensis]PRO67063.1 glycoside hydrolase [Alkalicoccus urumqiensis]